MAKRSAQAGIDAASVQGGEVWVAAGTYYERITLTPYAHAYGGFAGTEAVRTDRDWTAHPTIIDGENTRRGVLGANNATLDGFTIRNGYGFCSARG